MPIITTPGQPVQPVVKPDPIVPVHPRLQSAFTPSIVTPIKPPTTPVSTQPVVQSPIIEEDLDNDDDFDDDEDLSTVAPKSATPGVSLSRMSEEQRRKSITNVFSLVLGKNPSDRDFSYYRFSTLTEEGLIKSLLNLPEHKKLVDKAREHTALKQSVNDLDLQVKQLDATMQSMKQELITMQQLLVEKNRYIQQMRGITVESVPEQPAAKASSVPQIVQQPQPTAPVPQKPAVYAVETRKLPTPMDEIKNVFKGIFGGK